MKFKLLHVRPHVWFFKKETLAKSTSDDSSTEAPFVYKRSTSLKLVKSDPSVDISKGRGTPLDVKLSSTNTASSDIGSQNPGKDVRVCTVVDAGCTCRATVTSQHRQKRAAGAHPHARGNVGSIHDVCRPRRRTQILEARGNAGDVHSTSYEPRRMHLDAKHNSNSSPSVGMKSSVISRLVCKSSHDVVKHSELNVVNGDVVCKSLQDEGSKQFDAAAPYIVGMTHNKAGLDVHHLECSLRNAGLEERRRSSKKNKYYEEVSLTSSSISTSANTDTLMTGTTSEMQDMLLNANPAYDTDEASMGDNMFSLEDLRASIAQRKLVNHSLQASPCAKDAGPMDGKSGSAAYSESLSSFGPETVKAASTLLPPCLQNYGRQPQREKPEVSVKHVDAGVNNDVYLSECGDQPNEGMRRKAGGDTPSKIKDVGREDSALPRRAARRIHLSMRKGAGAQYELEKSSANRMNVGLAQGEVHGDAELDAIALDGRVCDGFEDDIGQEKQVVSSSSCEIQVLSDYNYSDDNHAYPMMRSGTSSLSTNPGVLTRALEMTTTTLGHELMRSQSAVAMVKSSYDPMRDFKESMLEMVVAKRLRAPRQLEQLLQCYLSLNPSHYHPTIIKVFHELCSELFN